jgi:uncharacterized protein (TIGR02145 family)
MSGRIGPPKTIPPPPPLPSVVIGTQEWTLNNLDVTTYRDGTIIPEVTNSTAWAALTTGAWCYYNNDSANGAIYGKLYNWYAVNDPKGLAPTGYHVPFEPDIQTLINSLGGYLVTGGKLKETGTTHWNSPNTGATNSSGWTGLPGGLRIQDGSFIVRGLTGYWWNSTSVNSLNASAYTLSYNNTSIGVNNGNKLLGLSVRLIKD